MLQCSNFKNVVKIHCPSLCLYFISIQKKKRTYGLEGRQESRQGSIEIVDKCIQQKRSNY